MNDKKHFVIGYGTFITRRLWTEWTNDEIDIVIVEGYTRILKSKVITSYPFVLENPEGKFVAIMFSIMEKTLPRLDAYESAHNKPEDPENGLYYRKEIEVTKISDGSKQLAWIYLPSKATINNMRLSLQDDTEDKWLKEIAVSKINYIHPELLMEPEELV